MFNFLRTITPDISSFIAFWQFVKHANMDYNEFKGKLLFKANDEAKFRKLWDDIHFGRAKFDDLKKDYVEKTLDKNSKSISDYINSFLDIIYQAQTGITMYPFCMGMRHYNDIIDWDALNIEKAYDKLQDAVKEVPFITKTVKFDAKKNKTPNTHISITTIEQKVPNGPFTIKEYDSDNNIVNEFTSNSVHCPLIYEWDKDDGTKEQKPGNLLT